MEIVVRAVIVFVFLWIVTRIVGRATLGELSTFELILFITMGDLVQQAVTQGIERISDVKMAVLEANGQLSFFTSDGSSDSGSEKPEAG